MILRGQVELTSTEQVTSITSGASALKTPMEDHSKVSLLERFFVILVLYSTTSARIPILEPLDNSSDERVFLVRMMAFASATLLIVLRPKSILRTALLGWPIVTLIALGLFSSFWASDPWIALQNGIVIAGLTFFGFYIGSRYSTRELIDLLSTLFLLIAILSIVNSALGNGGMDAGGYWRGVLGDKNVFGALVAVGAVVWAVKALRKGGMRLISMVCTILMTTLVLLSSSATSLVMVILMICVLSAIYAAQRIRGLGTIFLATASLAGAATLVWYNILYSRILDLLGREGTFTGRTQLWQFGLELAQEQWLLGYGLASVWGEFGMLSYTTQMREVGWIPQHAHNGYIDLWLQFGIMGVLLFAVSLLQVLPSCLRILQRGPSDSLFLPLMLVFIVVFNLVESALMTHFEVLWIIYVAIYTQLRTLRQTCFSIHSE